MIISGGSRSNWRFFAKHLMRVDENERVELREIRGLGGETVLEALREIDALASGTRCKNAFYHANLNPRAEETLTPEQWDHAVDTLEAELGLDGHSRFVVAHHKEGRDHIHVIWSRIDVDTMTAVPDSMNYAAHERTARALEREFGHLPVVGAHERTGERPKRRPKNWETFRGHDRGIDPQDITREVTALWQQADSGKAFAASLAAHGYQLCKGDRRDFCIMDAAGDIHSLARRIDGAKAADIRARLAHLDRDALPSTTEAQPITPSLAKDEPAAPSPATESRDASAASRLLDAFAAEFNRSQRPPKTRKKKPAPSINNWWNQPVTAPIVLEAGLTLLDHFARTMAKVMKANGGEPVMNDGLTPMERRVLLLVEAGKQAAQWVIGTMDDLMGHLYHSKVPQHDVEPSRNEKDRGLDR